MKKLKVKGKTAPPAHVEVEERFINNEVKGKTIRNHIREVFDHG